MTTRFRPTLHLNSRQSHQRRALARLLSSLSGETLLVIGAYIALGGAYLVVVPLALMAWMAKRWTVMGKLERTGVYGLVFLFFPGLILFAPFVNLRLQGQGPQL